MKSTKKLGGKVYKKKSCHTSKTAATKAAKTHRAKGKKARARVVKNGSGYCVYTRG